MQEKPSEEAHETDRRIAMRWKVLQALGAILIALGLLIDWSPQQEASLPDTSSFLMIIGTLLGVVGLMLSLRGGPALTAGYSTPPSLAHSLLSFSSVTYMCERDLVGRGSLPQRRMVLRKASS